MFQDVLRAIYPSVHTPLETSVQRCLLSIPSFAWFLVAPAFTKISKCKIRVRCRMECERNGSAHLKLSPSTVKFFAHDTIIEKLH